MDKARVELESRYTFLEQTVSELNDVVYGQSKKIDALEAALKKLRARLEDLAEGDAPAGREPPPPHY